MSLQLLLNHKKSYCDRQSLSEIVMDIENEIVKDLSFSLEEMEIDDSDQK